MHTNSTLTTPTHLIEVKLQLLVGIVDAELLEGIQLEDLETEDVQDADGVRCL